MVAPVLFSSATEEWETPQDLFDRLNSEFHFNLDVAATEANAKCAWYYDKAKDGLERPWRGRCWLNPPYGKTIGAWVKKAYESGRDGDLVVCLLPARTDTRWFHDYAMKATEIRFIRGRLRFGGSCNSAPFLSAVVVFSGSERRAISAMDAK